MSSKSKEQISMLPGDGMHDELDEHFLKRMNELTECRPVDWQPKKRLTPTVSHFCRLFWCVLGQFSRIDLYGGLQTYDDPTNKWRWRYRENFDRRYSSVNKQRWWQPLALTLYCYSSVRIFSNWVCQYFYDSSYIRLELFRALTTRDNKVDVSSQLKANANSRFISYIKSLMAPQMAEEYVFMSIPLVNVSNSFEGGSWRSATSELASMAEQLNAQVTSRYALMKRIGAPYIRLHFVIQICYFFMFISTFILVVAINFYYEHIKPFNYGLTRAFLDFKHERRIQNRLILDELNKFIVSSRNFTRTCIAQLKLDIKEHLPCSEQSGANRRAYEKLQANSRLESNRFLLDHIFIKRQLKQMALNGLLLPLHRTPNWVEQTSLLTVFLDLSAMLYMLLCTLYFAFIFSASSHTYQIELSRIDILVILEAGIQLTFIIPIIIFFIAQIIANCVDQIFYSFNICRQIEQCIATNRGTFERIIELQQCQSHLELALRSSDNVAHESRSSRKLGLLLSAGSRSLISSFNSVSTHEMDGDEFYLHQGQEINANRSHRAPSMDLCQRSLISRTLLVESHCTRMNAELLKVFMQYKVFVAQIKPIIKSFGTFATVLLVTLVVTPLSVRMHSPYLDNNTKLYSMSFNLMCATVVNLCYIPMCYMHSRCIDLHARLSSLLAHVTEVATHQRTLAAKQRSDSEANLTSHDLGGLQAYDSHTIWLLRKELNHPHQMASQFAIHAASISLTYSKLLKLHFWLGIITLSMVVESTNNQDFFGRIFNDPFGIFNWVPQLEGSPIRLSSLASGQHLL